MMKRRIVMKAGLLATCIGGQGLGQTASDAEAVLLGELPPLPADLAAEAANAPAPYTELEPVGTARPTGAEIQMAFDILRGSPFGGPERTKPVDVAQYLLDVGNGAHGPEQRPFAREWPVRANPLIFHLFAATQTQPAGDTTAWCAAFVNWCILRSHARTADEIGRAPGGFSLSGSPFSTENLARFSTNHASSGSFRCWEETTSPDRGDVAVFKNAGTDSLTAICRGQGHVGFVQKHPATRGAGWLTLLGGNQTDPGSKGAVTEVDWRITSGSRFMKFVKLKA
jgi:hypothetical protein